jgi:plastocyanin
MLSGRLRLMAGVLFVAAMAVPAHAATVTIVMVNLVISPGEATAKVGDTIEWVNKDVVAHTATAKNGDFDVMIPPKKTVTYVLKKAGTIDYYCRFHPNMKAVLKIDSEARASAKGGPKSAIP